MEWCHAKAPYPNPADGDGIGVAGILQLHWVAAIRPVVHGGQEVADARHSEVAGFRVVA